MGHKKQHMPVLLKAQDTWQKVKAKYEDAVVLVAARNRYYTFHKDAKILHKVMGYKLSNSILTRFRCSAPREQLEAIAHKLPKAGYKVAFCDPL